MPAIDLLLLLPWNLTFFKNEDSCGGRPTKHWKYKIPRVINIPLKILTEIIWSPIWQVIARKIILLRKNKRFLHLCVLDFPPFISTVKSREEVARQDSNNISSKPKHWCRIQRKARLYLCLLRHWLIV